MTDPARPQKGAHRLLRLVDTASLAWFVLAVSIAGTLVGWYLAQREENANASVHFKAEASSARTAIERRMESYIALLRSGGALFNATGKISHEQWHSYVSALRVDDYWPGIHGLGYVQMVLADAKAGRGGEPRAEYLFLEPSSVTSSRLIGYDPYAEPVRRAAMELARDSGAPAVSGRVQLLKATDEAGDDDRVGFVIYVPVYASGALPQTVEQRRLALRGFVFGAVRMSWLMRGILDQNGERIDLRIFDGASALPEALLYQSPTMPVLTTAGYSEVADVILPGRSWHLEMQGQAQYEASRMSGLPTAVGLGGALVDLLLLALILMLRANAASNAQLRKLSQALEQSLECVVITDTEGRIEYVNDAFVELTGYCRDEVIGNNPRFLQSGQTPIATFSAMWAALRQGNSWKGEFSNRKKDGSVYIEFAIITPLRGPDGTIAHYVAVKENITEKKRMGEELDFHRRHLEALVAQRTSELTTARQQADDANQAKSRFLASMSHEIRTPLNAVLGFAYICLNLDLRPRERAYIEKISRAGESLLGVVNDILDFSKADAGKLQLESIPFALSEVLQRVAALFQLATRSKGVELVIGALPGVPDNLVGDPLRLGQVLINLVGNAVKFTEHGEIHLTVEPLQLGADLLTLRFVVRDTGPGMSVEQQARLFTPFVQADSSITRKYGGTGLGLALCKQLVACMGGEIGVDSEVGVGSSFFFNAVFGSVAAIRLESAKIAGRTVLVVENSATMRSLLCHNVKSFGCQVEAVDGGKAALEKMASGLRADLILMDWHMPGRDGLATAHDIRSTGNEVPILLVSGDEPELARASALELGVRIDAFLCKPVPTAMLHAAMIDALVSPAPTPVEIVQPAPALGGKRILLVDDNDFNREIGRELCELTGAVVDTANDGAQAVAAVAGGGYDLVLMDIQMPVMDGYSATRIIRADRPDLPIIALTAHALHDEKVRVLACGMNALLTKPVLPGLLYATLARWLGARDGQRLPIADDDPPASAVLPLADQRTADGFDLTMALSRVNGDRALLDRFLRLFGERNATIVDEIGAALAGNDSQTARRLLHAFTGSAGTIGMVDLQSAARRLEAVLAADASGGGEPRGSAELAALQAAWRSTLKTLAALLDTVP